MVDLLLHWTVRLAFACYVATLALRIGGPCAQKRNRLPRILWTVGCALFLIHVWAAFQFVHHWSHVDAYQETARQTQLMTGVSSGAGLWLNYLFAALWLMDVAREWFTEPARPTWLEITLHAFFAFMWFNATIVFGHGIARWMGVAAVLLLIAMFLRRRSRNPGTRAA